MNLYDLSREIKSFLKEDKRDFGNLIHKNRAALVLVDGLGWNIAQNINVSVKPMKIDSIFPTITVTVFATLLTAKMPYEHGILGWRILDKEEGRIVNLMKVLREQSINLDTYFANTNSVFIMPEVATKSLISGLKVIPYFTYWDGLYKFMKALEERKAEFVFFYIPYVDAMSHLYGPFHEVTLKTAREILSEIAPIATKFKNSYTTLVTSDHGHTVVNNYVNLREDKEFLEEMEFPPYGDVRNLMFKAKRLPKSLTKYGTVYDREKVRELIGSEIDVLDYLLIPHDNTALVYWKDDLEHQYKGNHGGMTEDEMKIPLYIYE